MRIRDVEAVVYLEGFPFDPVNIILRQQVNAPATLSFTLPYRKSLRDILPGTEVIVKIKDTSLKENFDNQYVKNFYTDDGWIEWFKGYIVSVPGQVSFTSETLLSFTAIQDIGILSTTEWMYMMGQGQQQGVEPRMTLMSGAYMVPEFGGEAYKKLALGLFIPPKDLDDDLKKDFIKSKLYGLIYMFFTQKHYLRNFMRANRLIESILMSVNIEPFEYAGISYVLQGGVENRLSQAKSLWDFLVTLLDVFFHEVISVFPSRLLPTDTPALDKNYLPSNVAEALVNYDVANFPVQKGLELDYGQLNVVRTYIKPDLIDTDPIVENILYPNLHYSDIIYTEQPPPTRFFTSIFMTPKKAATYIYPAELEAAFMGSSYYLKAGNAANKNLQANASNLFYSGLSQYMTNEEKVRNDITLGTATVDTMTYLRYFERFSYDGKTLTAEDEPFLFRELARRAYFRSRQSAVTVSGDLNLLPLTGFSAYIVGNGQNPSILGYLESKVDSIDFSEGTATTTYEILNPRTIKEEYFDTKVSVVVGYQTDNNESFSYVWNYPEETDWYAKNIGTYPAHVLNYRFAPYSLTNDEWNEIYEDVAKTLEFVNFLMYQIVIILKTYYEENTSLSQDIKEASLKRAEKLISMYLRHERILNILDSYKNGSLKKFVEASKKVISKLLKIRNLTLREDILKLKANVHGEADNFQLDQIENNIQKLTEQVLHDYKEWQQTYNDFIEGLRKLAQKWTADPSMKEFLEKALNKIETLHYKRFNEAVSFFKNNEEYKKYKRQVTEFERTLSYIARIGFPYPLIPFAPFSSSCAYNGYIKPKKISILLPDIIPDELLEDLEKYLDYPSAEEVKSLNPRRFYTVWDILDQFLTFGSSTEPLNLINSILSSCDIPLNSWGIMFYLLNLYTQKDPGIEVFMDTISEQLSSFRKAGNQYLHIALATSSLFVEIEKEIYGLKGTSDFEILDRWEFAQFGQNAAEELIDKYLNLIVYNSVYDREELKQKLSFTSVLKEYPKEIMSQIEPYNFYLAPVSAWVPGYEPLELFIWVLGAAYLMLGHKIEKLLKEQNYGAVSEAALKALELRLTTFPLAPMHVKLLRRSVIKSIWEEPWMYVKN